MPMVIYNIDPNDPARQATLSGLTAAKHPELAGVAVYDDVIQMTGSMDYGFELMWDYSVFPVTLRGHLQRRVVRSTKTGLHSFYYRVSVDSSSVAHVSALIVYPLAGSKWEVDYRLDGLGDAAPNSAATLPIAPYGDFNGAKPEIAFLFDNLIKPGQSSKFLLVTPFAEATSHGGVDFAHSGAKGFTPTGGDVAVRIVSSPLHPIGYSFPGPNATEHAPSHPHPSVGNPFPGGRHAGVVHRHAQER